MAGDLKAGQPVAIKFPDGQVLAGVVKAANPVLACFDPGDGTTIFLRRDLAEQPVPVVWRYNRQQVEIAVAPSMTLDEFNRRVAALQARLAKTRRAFEAGK